MSTTSVSEAFGEATQRLASSPGFVKSVSRTSEVGAKKGVPEPEHLDVVQRWKSCES
jgi:hypothetical protein